MKKIIRFRAGRLSISSHILSWHFLIGSGLWAPVSLGSPTFWLLVRFNQWEAPAEDWRVGAGKSRDISSCFSLLWVVPLATALLPSRSGFLRQPLPVEAGWECCLRPQGSGNDHDFLLLKMSELSQCPLFGFSVHPLSL